MSPVAGRVNPTFPVQLMQVALWFLWKLVEETSGSARIPIYKPFSALTGKPMHDSADGNYVPYNDAKYFLNASNEYGGLGILIGDGVFAVEIGNSVDETNGKVVGRAVELLNRFSTICQYNVEGTGIVLLFTGKPDGTSLGCLYPTISAPGGEYLLCLSGKPVPGTGSELFPIGLATNAIREHFSYGPPSPAAPQLGLFTVQLPVAPPPSPPPVPAPSPQAPASAPPARPDRRFEEPIRPPEPDPKRSENIGNEPQEWQVPKSFEAIATAVLPFNTAWLPEPFVAYVQWIAATLQIPVDFPSILILAALGGLALRRFCVQPRRKVNWPVFSNLWCLIVAEPGFMKTACMKMAMFALLERESGTRSARFFTSDTTVAKLQEIVAENPAGLTVFRDEIFGFFLSLNRKGQESDRQFFLEGWDGDTPFMVDRIGRGTIFIAHLCLSIIGSLQPGKLDEFVAEALKVDDGFAARFQLLIMPDLPTDFEYVEDEPDPDAKVRIMAIHDAVLEWDPEYPREFRFDELAQDAFESWYTQLMQRVRRKDGLLPAMRSHLGKFPSLMPAIAGLIHVAEDPDSERIPLDRARRAIELCEYLESHASRVYSRTFGYRFGPTSILAGRIRDRALKARFTVREVYNHGWTGLGDAEAVRKALGELREAGWVRPCSPRSESTGGRPSETWEINPAVYEA